MACFIATAVEAAVVTVIEKRVEKKEIEKVHLDTKKAESNKLPLSQKIKWLRNLLLGGSFLLAFEHIWHGEVVPYFPFLTAAANAEDRLQMLKEMALVGGSMMLLVTAVWGAMLLVSHIIEKRGQEENTAEE